MPVEPEAYVRDSGLRVILPEPIMNAEEWALALLLVLGAVVMVHHLGVDVGGTVSRSLHGLEHFLGQPL
jgi:hypothetical protein